MFKFSALADYGLMLITHINPNRFTSVSELMRTTRLPAPTLAKLATKLGKHNLLISKEGRGGGYRLARAADEITLREVVEALEGPIAPAKCIARPGSCAYERDCDLRPHWPRLTSDLVTWAESYTIEDLTHQRSE